MSGFAQALGVGRIALIPHQLTKRPFSLDDARRAGLTKSSLRGKSWRRLGAELYCWMGLTADSWMVLSAWQRQFPPDIVFAGKTAAWLLGLDLDPLNPIGLIVPLHSGVRSRPGLDVRRCDIPQHDVIKIRGLPATTVNRTLSDLCLRLPPVEALVVIDAAVHLGLTDNAALIRYAELAGGRPGVRRLRSLTVHAAPAESPMETRLRWLLLRAGLPPPEVQSELHDVDGRFVGRADLYYPAARLVIEYDGSNHRDRLVEDDRRQNRLINAGFVLLRFTAADIHNRPESVEALVRRAVKTPLTPKDPNPGGRYAPLDTTRRNRSVLLRG